MSNTAPSRADPVVVFPLGWWCPPQETSQPHPPPNCIQWQYEFNINTLNGNKTRNLSNSSASTEPADIPAPYYVFLTGQTFIIMHLSLFGSCTYRQQLRHIRQTFEMHFLETNCLNYQQNCIEMCSGGINYNKSDGCWKDDKPLCDWTYYEPDLWCNTFNSLGPNDAIWWDRSGSTLAQVIDWCRTAPSHYMNQCWLIISKVLWHSSEGNFVRDTSVTIQ